MLKNNNKDVIIHITRSSLAASKGRNRLIGAVILLSALLFSLCTTFGINTALDMRDITGGSLETLRQIIPVLGGVAAVIILACVLAVYNIFFVSVARRISEYGQLRTIGATGIQIKKMVRKEGMILSARFIPPGILLGGVVSFLVTPVKWYWGPSLLCLFIAGAVTFVSVWFSTARPGKFAASVSPVEALRHTGARPGNNLIKKTAKNLSAASLGIANLAGSKKKTVLTFLSLSLSGILFIGAASVMNALDPARMAKERFIYGGEYKFISTAGSLLSDTSYLDMQLDNPLNEDLKEKLLQIDGITGIEEGKSVEAVLPGEEDIPTAVQSLRPSDRERLTEGSLDGGGMVINKGNEYVKYLNKTYRLGDTVTLILEDGHDKLERSFTVTGIIADNDRPMTFHLPGAVIDEIMTTNNNQYFEILSTGSYSPERENAVRDLIAGEEKLSFESLRSLTDMYKNYFRVATSAILCFVIIIGIFALVNLINTIITNTLQRKKEIGIFQAVGLSKQQFKQMLWAEYSITLLGSFIISLVLGGAAGYGIVTAAANMDGFLFLEYHFPLVQVLVYFMLIMSVLFVLTVFLERSMAKQSVVERIREL